MVAEQNLKLRELNLMRKKEWEENIFIALCRAIAHGRKLSKTQDFTNLIAFKTEK
jgi:hypothetical protein